MKCLETNRLMSYALHLLEEPAASQVRQHLGECAPCRQVVEQHQRLSSLLDGWRAAEPTSGFDARVRQAVEAEEARRGAWSIWGREWVRGLALATLGILLIAGAVWLARNHRLVSNAPNVALRQTPPASGAPGPAQTATSKSPNVVAQANVHPARAFPQPKSAGASLNAETDAQALEDYDLAANFDVLSELPKGEARVAN